MPADPLTTTRVSGVVLSVDQTPLVGVRQVDQVLAQDDGAGNLFWRLADHFGTVRDLAGPTGTIVNHLKHGGYK